MASDVVDETERQNYYSRKYAQDPVRIQGKRGRKRYDRTPKSTPDYQSRLQERRRSSSTTIITTTATTTSSSSSRRSRGHRKVSRSESIETKMEPNSRQVTAAVSFSEALKRQQRRESRLKKLRHLSMEQIWEVMFSAVEDSGDLELVQDAAFATIQLAERKRENIHGDGDSGGCGGRLAPLDVSITPPENESFELPISLRNLRKPSRRKNSYAVAAAEVMTDQDQVTEGKQKQQHFQREELTLMETACLFGRLSIARWLFRSGVSVRTIHPISGFTPLHFACKKRTAFMLVKWLLTEAGAYGDSDLEAKDGVTTPRTLGLDQMMQLAKKASLAEIRVQKAQKAREAETERRQAEEIIQRAKRKREKAAWNKKLQMAVISEQRENLGDEATHERWFERLWGELEEDAVKEKAMSSEEWADLLRAQALLAKARQALVVHDDDDDDDDDDDGGTGNDEKWQQRSKRKRRRKRSSSSGKYHHLPGSDEKFVEIEHKWLSFKNMLVGGEECFAKGEQGECNRQEKIALSSFSSSGTASIVSTSPPPVSLSSNKNEKRMGIRKKELELDDIPFPTPPPYETGAPKPDTFGPSVSN